MNNSVTGASPSNMFKEPDMLFDCHVRLRDFPDQSKTLTLEAPTKESAISGLSAFFTSSISASVRIFFRKRESPLFPMFAASFKSTTSFPTQGKIILLHLRKLIDYLRGVFPLYP